MPEMDNASFQRGRDRFDPPDVPAILSYGAIGGELAHAGDIQGGHASPAFLVVVSFIELVLDLYIGREVSEQQERVVIQQGIEQRFEQIQIAVGKMARMDAFDGPL